MPDFDVLIIGAGPAGALSAFLLARAGLRVALFERARFPRDKVCGDGITPRGARLLQELGLLGAIEERAFACRGVTLRGSDDNSFDIDLKADRAQPSALLVLPRLQLDALLLQHALAAGPKYFEQTKVERVDSQAEQGAAVFLADGRRISGHIALVASGAESQLLRHSGLLRDKPHLEHAARGYFDGVEGLTNRVTLFFDGIDMPGYGWIFPTSATSANIGCGVFSRAGRPQLSRLRTLIAEHPLLKRMLRHAEPNGIAKAYPLRTDFRPEHAGQGQALCLGEAAGLVNPVTGEGIDYAFESARFASEAVLESLSTRGSAAALPIYRSRLEARFARRFAIYRWVQDNCLSSGQADEFLAAVKASPALQQTVVNGLFGRARPADYLRLPVLLPALRLAMLSAKRKKAAALSS